MELAVLCGRKKSKITALTKRYRFIRLCDFDLPSPKDGFLATNSVIAFAVLLTRAYAKFFNSDFPNSFEEFLGTETHLSSVYPRFKNKVVEQVLPKNMLFAFYGKWGKPAAFDLESKLVESALRLVQLSDYRNFAHGRHNWLAKRGDETGIVAFMTKDERSIAEKTISLLPADIPVAKVQTEKQGPIATIELLAQVLLLTKIFGEYCGIDLAHPHIPAFGRTLFHLTAPISQTELPQPFSTISKSMKVAIERKTGESLPSLCLSTIKAQFWINAYSSFIAKISATTFDKLALDYDGTLCSNAERFIGPSDKIAYQVNKLLECQVAIGIATGRGASARTNIRRIIKEEFWDQVLVGYYNGSDIGRLCDDSHPNTNLPTDPQLAAVIPCLSESQHLQAVASFKTRPMQISFSPKDEISLRYLDDVLHGLLDGLTSCEVQILESSHSIDVIPSHVSKLDLVQTLVKLFAKNNEGNVLSIGDKGRWPGNDYALLSSEYSLSVDQFPPVRILVGIFRLKVIGVLRQWNIT